MTSVHLAKALEFVRLGFGDLADDQFQFRSLNFLTDELTTKEAEIVIGELGEFNAFKGSSVANAITRFHGRVKCWVFGREGSPVLYAYIPFWTHQIEGQDSLVRGERLADHSRKQLVADITKLFKHELGADDVTSDETQDQIRIWWD